MQTFILENVSRSKFRLPLRPFVTTHPDGSTTIERVTEHLVIGDAADSDAALAAKGIERNVRCPSPVVTITASDYEQLTDASKRALHALVEGTTLGPGPAVKVVKCTAPNGASLALPALPAEPKPKNRERAPA